MSGDAEHANVQRAEAMKEAMKVPVDSDDVVRLIRAMHHDMVACHCWICEFGREHNISATRADLLRASAILQDEGSYYRTQLGIERERATESQRRIDILLDLIDEMPFGVVAAAGREGMTVGDLTEMLAWRSQP